MKGLFIHFFELNEFSGICKKIISQINALENSGLEMQLCHIEIDKKRVQRRLCSGIEIDNFGNGLISRFGKWLCFGNLIRYIISSNIQFVYIRSFYNSNPFFLRMLSKLKRKGIIIVMEYPTYPYDKETEREYYLYKPIFFLNKIFRNFLKGRLDRIITFTNLEFIDGVKTINISNGIDFSSVRMADREYTKDNIFNLLGVAEVHFWHGFDRVIAGLADYYKNKNQGSVVHFHIVGAGAEADLAKLKEMTFSMKMNDYVHFYGNRNSDELDEFFNLTDFGIASLARHRTGIVSIKTLKNREYAARGIPFIYSETDEDFDQMPYVLKAPADESPIDIGKIIEFKKSLQLTPIQIRESIMGKLSWNIQMEKIVRELIPENKLKLKQ